nr:glutathione S-transferase GSTS1/2-3 [Brachionus angularis]
MVQYKLNYFNGRGRAELSRLLFAAAGQKYEDVRIEGAQWPQLKNNTPLGQLPFLEINDNGKVTLLSQSTTIARYLARKFNLAGKGDEEQAIVEMYGDQVSDLINEFFKVYFEKDQTKKTELNKKLYEEIIPNNLRLFESRIGSTGSGYIAASGLTWADLYLFNILEYLGDKKEQILSSFLNVKALDQRIRANPNIASWLSKRPKTEM